MATKSKILRLHFEGQLFDRYQLKVREGANSLDEIKSKILKGTSLSLGENCEMAINDAVIKDYDSLKSHCLSATSKLIDVTIKVTF